MSSYDNGSIDWISSQEGNIVELEFTYGCDDEEDGIEVVQGRNHVIACLISYTPDSTA